MYFQYLCLFFFCLLPNRFLKGNWTETLTFQEICSKHHKLMFESLACDTSDNGLQKYTMPKLFANAILCQKCLQMSQRATQYETGPFLNLEWLLLHEGLIYGLQNTQCLTDACCAPLWLSSVGNESMRRLTGIVPCFSASDILEKILFSISQSIRKTIWWQDNGCSGTEERIQVYCAD